ncbi:glycosyltransferase family 2 protein [Brevundimonas sp. SGAir0440]|uniref:glycosyltransferase family 2 protein n=1 Tax=Brevundimonas sp. SGAir0440 TaxID=2579977 RepID=UPI00143D0B7C|nr:glycosyltransferase family 2 protein [Brevundimonas sp. SGAir0440]
MREQAWSHLRGKAQPSPPKALDAADFQRHHHRVLFDGGEATIKIDHVLRVGGKILLLGWTSEPDPALELQSGSAPLAIRVRSASRPDVSAFLETPASEYLGFVICAQWDVNNETPTALTLKWRPRVGGVLSSTPLLVEHKATTEAFEHVGDLVMEELAARPFGSAAWLEVLSAFPKERSDRPIVAGAVDFCVIGPDTAGGAISGWALHEEPATFWIEDDDGGLCSFENAQWWERPDVLNMFDQMNVADPKVGFMVRVPGLRPRHGGAFYAASRQGVSLLARFTAPKILSADPKKAAAELFAVPSPPANFIDRVSAIDWPILGPIVERHQERLQELPVEVSTVGFRCASPKVSVVIPLYGRMDFVEHQLMCFSLDPYIRDHCEILYVVDDERLIPSMMGSAQELLTLYGTPFTWIWGSINRGFSGANNLGAAHARADALLFLNSDVFPKEPGWLEQLVAALDNNPDIGIIGPRLLFAEGGIQHAGMINRRLESLGIWINHHVKMGFDPAADSHVTLARMELITGACALMRRDDFVRLGGWDVGYLIGDFEDSDLCFKVRQDGMTVGYLPTIELTHLERQSFALWGESDFRSKITLANAARHQARWKQFLESPISKAL